MQKKIKLIKRICIATILIFSMLISTMPYKPKILWNEYNAKTVKAMSSENLQLTSNKSNITISKIDSKTKEPLEDVGFELTPIEENIIDNMIGLKKYYISYYVEGNIFKLETYHGESYGIIDSCNVNNLKGWATSEDSNDIVYLPGDTVYINKNIELHAVTYKLEDFSKSLVKSKSELPSNIPENLPAITYIENKEKVEFVQENSQITLLYKLTAKGDPGLNYTIRDTGAQYAFGDPLSGTISESGEINCYVTKSFSPSDINSEGNIENVARITPGLYGDYEYPSVVSTPAEDNTPSYTVTYSDGTGGYVFGQLTFGGIKFGQKTPEFIGSLKRSGYEFMGWTPSLCETVEYDMDYMATWMKRAELTIITYPDERKANVGDTVHWYVQIDNSNWTEARNIKLENTLNNGKSIYTKENIFLNPGESFKTTIEYVVTEEDAGKSLINNARITDFGDEHTTATPLIYGGSHSGGIEISAIEALSNTNTYVSKVPTSAKSFSNERALIPNINEKEYAFVKDESGVYKSNNQGVGSSDASSYIPIDLSNYSGKYILEVNASISSERNYDYGAAELFEQEGDKIDFGKISETFIYISGKVENENYRIALEGGKKYNILFKYVKDSSVNDGEDVFTINSVKVLFNSEGLTEKIPLVTDSNGKIVTEIPDGRYILTETKSAEGYKILEYPIIIEVKNNEIKILENKNKDVIKVINNNELEIENTTSRVIVHYYLKNNEGGYTETKLKQDKIIKGIEGSGYNIEPLLCIQKDGIDYELEYEIENGTRKYITPENQTGIFGKEDINVNYYYQAKKRIIINKIWADNNNSLGIRPDCINVILKAEVENEEGNIVTYPINSIETEVELNNSNNWTYTWANLETYDEKGKEIRYCIEELDVPEQYYSVISSEDYEHYDITNYKYGSIKIVKVDSKNNNTKLGGAEFKLEKLIEENEKINIDENFEPIILMTSTEEETLGEVVFENLEYGKYRLTEIKAPNGYKLQSKAIDIEITEENPDFVGNIVNKQKTMLPSTGGNGSIALTMLGVFFIAIAIKIKDLNENSNTKDKKE